MTCVFQKMFTQLLFFSGHINNAVRSSSAHFLHVLPVWTRTYVCVELQTLAAALGIRQPFPCLRHSVSSLLNIRIINLAAQRLTFCWHDMSCSHISYFLVCLITSGGKCFTWVLRQLFTFTLDVLTQILLLTFSQQACLFRFWCIWGELSFVFYLCIIASCLPNITRLIPNYQVNLTHGRCREQETNQDGHSNGEKSVNVWNPHTPWSRIFLFSHFVAKLGTLHQPEMSLFLTSWG